jgi:hypothetical protein
MESLSDLLEIVESSANPPRTVLVKLLRELRKAKVDAPFTFMILSRLIRLT